MSEYIGQRLNELQGQGTQSAPSGGLIIDGKIVAEAHVGVSMGNPGSSGRIAGIKLEDFMAKVLNGSIRRIVDPEYLLEIDN